MLKQIKSALKASIAKVEDLEDISYIVNRAVAKALGRFNFVTEDKVGTILDYKISEEELLSRCDIEELIDEKIEEHDEGNITEKVEEILEDMLQREVENIIDGDENGSIEATIAERVESDISKRLQNRELAPFKDLLTLANQHATMCEFQQKQIDSLKGQVALLQKQARRGTSKRRNKGRRRAKRVVRGQKERAIS